jgi:glycerophosphoryl diester phosphodiesterase
LADENRIRAFEIARTVGADGVELDVRRSYDGHLPVWHDPALPDGRALLSTPWDELRQNVDELDAVLDVAFGTDLPGAPSLQLVNVEIKNQPGEDDYEDPTAVAGGGFATTVADRLATRPTTQHSKLVASCFDPTTLAAVRRRLDEVAPQIRTGWLVWLVTEVAQAVELTLEGGHAALHPHHAMVTPELVDAAHEADLTVNCWTCNDPDRIRWLADIGTDGIITDDPKAALAVLGR